MYYSAGASRPGPLSKVNIIDPGERLAPGRNEQSPRSASRSPTLRPVVPTATNIATPPAHAVL
jgi:hypothetical protein